MFRLSLGLAEIYVRICTASVLFSEQVEFRVA